MERADDTVLVLLQASPEVIRDRMRSDPHDRTVVKDEDVGKVLERFEYHFNHSLLRYKFSLDTSTSSPDQTLEEFVAKYLPHLTQRDQLRIQTRQSIDRA